jgi:hypothetical protein
MKLILAILFLAMPLQAASVSLAWDASPSAAVEGYAIFSKDFQHPYDYAVPLWKGTGLTCTVTVPDDRQTAFVARAWGYGPYDLDGKRETVWSDSSNQVVYVPVKVIEPPRNLIVRILQALVKFFGNLFG